METLTIIALALLPVVILLFYINYKDRYMPEPPGQLVKAFFYGVLSLFLSFTISVPLLMMGLYTLEPQTVLGAIQESFIGAAIPEECTKLFMLWLLLRRNRYFDERMDGIVYAVCVSLGFAAIENINYLFMYYESYVRVGIIRAIFTIPLHFYCGVLMGYYYSLVTFSPHDSKKNMAMVLVAPILAHGIFDSIALITGLSTHFSVFLSVFLTIIFLIFCHYLWKYCTRKISEHLERDGIIEKN